MIDLTPIIRLGLLLVRPGMVIMTAPGFGGTYAPAMVKIGLTVMVAVSLLPSVHVTPAANEMSVTIVVMREAAIGLAFAIGSRALIAAAEFGGHLAGFQIGYSYGATIDPVSGVRDTMLASLYGMLALFTFLAVNGHHQLLRALAQSYTALPIGAGSIHGSLSTSVGDIFAIVFVTALRLAAPVVILLLVIEVGIGLISRAAPALSSMVIGYPLRLIAGLIVVAALIGTVPGVVTSLVDRVIVQAAAMAAAFR